MENKPKLGRPFIYDANYHPAKLVSLMETGALRSQVCSAFDVCRDTLYDWKSKYPEFKEALGRGVEKAESFWAEKLQTMVLEKNDAGCKACIMILNNNFGWGKNENTSNVTNNTQINIKGNMQVLQAKSTDELLDILRGDVEYLTNNQVIDVKLIDEIEVDLTNDTRPNKQE